MSIQGMGNFNKLTCNRYEARSVAVMVSQYLIACSEKKSKDKLKSDFIDIRNYSG